MGIKADTKAVDTLLDRSAKIFKECVHNAMAKLGEECVAKIRDRSQEESWFDHSGNLRSSIGYAVYDEGVVLLQSTFPVVLTGGEGSAKGKQMVQDLAKEVSNTIALVVLAGMEYGSYVEAIEGKDVLEGTRLWALSIVNQRLQNAVNAAVEKINRL